MALKDIYDVIAEEKRKQSSFGTEYASIPRGRVAGAVLGDLGGMLAGQVAESAGYMTPGQQRQANIMKVREQFPNPQTDAEFRSLGNALNAIGETDMAEQAFDQIKDTSKTDSRSTMQKNIEYFAGINNCVPGTEGYSACMQKSIKDAQEFKRAGAEEKYKGALATKTAEDVVEKNSALITNAGNAVDALIKTNEVISLLDKGELHTGMFADFKTNISRILSVAGSDVSSGYASRTQLLEALLGSDVFPMIKQLGIGARGLDTPAEREFLLKVMTGDIKMEADTIRKMTEIRQRISKKIIEKYNNKVEKGGFDYYTELTGEDVPLINIDAYTKKSVIPKGSQRGTLSDGTIVWRYPDGTFHKEDGSLVQNIEVK